MKVHIGPYRKNRKINIRIDLYDTWNMDHTLTLIILPMLKQLKEQKQGSPNVDLDDVPENLHPDPNRIKLNVEGKVVHWDIDNTVHDRWNYVIDEMIWVFEILNTEEQEYVYNENGTINFEKTKENEKRIDNGLLLFGKYFRSLWS